MMNASTTTEQPGSEAPGDEPRVNLLGMPHAQLVELFSGWGWAYVVGFGIMLARSRFAPRSS